MIRIQIPERGNLLNDKFPRSFYDFSVQYNSGILFQQFRNFFEPGSSGASGKFKQDGFQ